MAHADIYGIVKSKRTGETFPVAILTEKAIAAYLAEEARIEERQHRRAAEADDSLEGIIAELAGGKDDGDE